MFLVYIVIVQGIKVDEDKVKVIQDWPTPKSMIDLYSFYGLSSWYRCFVQDLNTIVAPLNKIVKKFIVFKCDYEQDMAFNLLKEKLYTTHVLAFLNFTKTFEIECDAYV